MSIFDTDLEDEFEGLVALEIDVQESDDQTLKPLLSHSGLFSHAGKGKQRGCIALLDAADTRKGQGQIPCSLA